MIAQQIVPFGIEIEHDAASSPSAENIEELQALYAQHHLMVFRRQKLTHDQQARFAHIFGPGLANLDDGRSYVSNVPGAGLFGDSELEFHSDLAFTPQPYRGICLHAVDVEDGQSSTRFISSSAAYASLPDELRDEVDGLHALHVLRGARLDRNNLPKDIPSAVHPIVMTHPSTAEPLLYIAYDQTVRIVEMSPEDSVLLLKRLFAHLYRPENVYEHKWKIGDLVMWDNLALQHARGSLIGAGRRTLQRVALGTRGFFEQFPQFKPEQYVTRS